MLRIQSILSAKNENTRHFSQGVSLTSRLLFVALALLSSFTTQAAEDGLFRLLAPETANLAPYQWHNRPLVIFAPSDKDPHYVQQIAMLQKAQADLAERDIIVLSDTSPAANGHLRAQLKPKGFEVVLVGKDGGMKLREQRPISTEALLSTIDRMPMRKANLD